MIDNIVGMGSLPVGIILFLNAYGITNMNSFLGMDMLMIAAIVLILVQVSNIVGAHIIGENIFLSYVVHFFLIFPSFLYFLGFIVSLPQAVINSFPIVFASFILIEGLYSFFF